MYSEIKRSFLFCALLAGLGMGMASAYDYCSPCAPAPRPVAVAPACLPSSPCAPAPVAVVPAPACAPSNPCGVSVYPTTTYGTYESSVAGYVTSPYGGRADRNITYLVPTMHGLLETGVLPVADNEVDIYYATHRVQNGQVVAVPLTAPLYEL